MHFYKVSISLLLQVIFYVPWGYDCINSYEYSTLIMRKLLIVVESINF
jgi:hypothetical protein